VNGQNVKRRVEKEERERLLKERANIKYNGKNDASNDVRRFYHAMRDETDMEACRVCAVEQGRKHLHFTAHAVPECDKGLLFHVDSHTDIASLLHPLRASYESQLAEAAQASGVERNAKRGRLTGLDEDGCMDGKLAMCEQCFKSLKYGKVPKNALINHTWQGLVPPELQFKTDLFPEGLNMVEVSMICLYCPISYITMLNGGTALGMKEFTVAFANNFVEVAKGVGRMPSPDLMAFLKREGVVQKKAARFRPRKVDDAITWLLSNNVVFAQEWASRQRHADTYPFHRAGEAEERYVDDDDMLGMSPEEAQAVDTMFESSDVFANTESDIVLYHNDAVEPMSREDHIRTNLEAATIGSRGRSLNLPRVIGDGGLAHPSFDKRFYEKSFPCLFPYGYGGPEDCHGLKMNAYVELLLKRGGNADMRRFGTYVPFMLAVYTYRMKKISGGVAYVASMSAEANGDSVAGPSGEGDDARGSRSYLFDSIRNAPDAKSIIEALETNKGELAQRILSRLEPYTERLVGSAPFIMHERKLLFAMLGSPVVRQESTPGIFSTIAPSDRFYPELPDILSNMYPPMREDIFAPKTTTNPDDEDNAFDDVDLGLDAFDDERDGANDETAAAAAADGEVNDGGDSSTDTPYDPFKYTKR